jgi:hypothetical protein
LKASSCCSYALTSECKCRIKLFTEKLQRVTKDRKAKADNVLQLQSERDDSAKEAARLRRELPFLEAEIDKLTFLAQGLLEMMPSVPS